MIELAEIFRQYGPAYRAQFSDQLLPSHRAAMWAIEHCRTEALGGHVYTCPDCDQTIYQYHSCRNRHCPKCQNEQAQHWLEQQRDWLLPVPYFMLTFTLPAPLRPIARSHQTLIYDLLFRTSAAATQHLAADPRFVGGQLGLVGVLHTWGRTLTYHPHVHYLIPAGGLAADQTWHATSSDFLVPVKALSGIFRARFRDALRPTEVFEHVPARVWQSDWVVHCQPPVGNGETAFKYLAPYIFRVAISNSRILKLENDQVTFRYRATGTGQPKLCTLAVQEFIQRFLQHVLPKGFVKVRYYGFLSAGQRAQLTALRQQLGASLATSFPTRRTHLCRPPIRLSLSRRSPMLNRCLTTQPHCRTRLTTGPHRIPTHRPPIPCGLIPCPSRDAVAQSVVASCSRARCCVPSPPRHTTTVTHPTLAAVRLKRLDASVQRVRSRTQAPWPCVLNFACLLTSPSRPFSLHLPHLRSWSLIRICPVWPPEGTMGLRSSRLAAESL